MISLERLPANPLPSLNRGIVSSKMIDSCYKHMHTRQTMNLPYQTGVRVSL